MLPLYKVLIALLFLPTIAYATVSPAAQKLMREAKAYYEAHNYPEAMNLYQSILQEPLSSWERAIVMYNLGSVWLSSGNWDQAVTTFQSVPMDNPLGPLLADRIHRNLMLTYLKKGVATKDPHLLNQVIDMVPEANQARCNLQKAEGAKLCEPSHDVAKMKIMAQSYLAHFFEKSAEQEMPLKETVGKLIKAVSEDSTNSRFMQNLMTRGFRKKYRSLFISEQKDTLPVWRVLQQKLENDNQEGSKERKALLVSAEKNFLEGNEQFHDASYELSSKSFEAAAKDLQELLRRLPPPPPSPSPQQAPQQAPKEQQSATEKEEQTEKVLQLLLQMEQQDRKPKSNQPLRKKEPKPW